MNKLSIPILSIFMIFFSGAIAQNKEGNIVEYFGKEKVNDVSEGEVIHLFKEGLILGTSGTPFSNSAIQYDPIFAEVLQNGFQINEGKEVFDSFKEETIAWENIAISENGEFNDPKLRRNGYLYLEYISEEERTVIFEASGHTNVIINGLPHEGDHYDFGWNLIPITLKKGVNKFLLSGGRFSRMRARLLITYKPVEFTTRDLTLPDVLQEEQEDLWGAIRIINTEKNSLKGAKIKVEINGISAETKVPTIVSKNVRKVPFSIPIPSNLKEGDSITANLYLQAANGRDIDTAKIVLDIKSKFKHHKNTFLSKVDNSVQYYSVAPSLTKNKENQALFLSVHGASVEAVNQANAYKQKDWGHVVAPTNRRPFGFAWEDWGRLDALEVLEHSEKLLKTDPQRTYLTGHSMGGHGSWYLGATYPDRFAAIAPAAGYPDLLDYRNSFISRISDEQIEKQFEMSAADFKQKINLDFKNTTEKDLDLITRRAGNPSRTLKLKNNYLHYGVYILHGDSDNVVPTYLAQRMREELGKFHNDFAYYEYPGGKHWFGNESVDWPPIFYFFNRRKIKSDAEMNKIDFSTASPGVSSKSHFITILQQEHPFEISNFKFERTENGLSIVTSNIKTLSVDLAAMDHPNLKAMVIDGDSISPFTSEIIYFENEAGSWKISEKPDDSEKSPLRSGGFKDAFRHNMVFVYGTKGSKEENEWYFNRAKFDAEKFWYRANGSVEVIKDTDFKASDYIDRNVIIYGNKSNNAAWKKLLKNSPVQFSKNQVKIGNKTLKGEHYGAYFIYPKENHEFASIGVVTASGIKGMHAAYANDYLENGTFYPDLLLFNDEMPKNGLSGIKASGFFGNNWSVENGEFVWDVED
ncbi:alpha/beta fold hydrolase [Zunongwangia endophytica]|uniref:Alpha/beta fold hydrolase n=1 Tax=Zunongwangia endophytica TaxID=1808945 RepID=A0ABV8H4M8_9FLAO|nr:prolyl oligopeptidase family serine peptidase [Zunongwangia endophytica]MDN3595425.1 prolyl oligopeptidase family serine peptidase [Zunongwangia endophytica]